MEHGDVESVESQVSHLTGYQQALTPIRFFVQINKELPVWLEQRAFDSFGSRTRTCTSSRALLDAGVQSGPLLIFRMLPIRTAYHNTQQNDFGC